jgi:PAS domain S-box-containing protein
MKYGLQSKWWTFLSLFLGVAFIGWSLYILVSVNAMQAKVSRNVGIINELNQVEQYAESMENVMIDSTETGQWDFRKEFEEIRADFLKQPHAGEAIEKVAVPFYEMDSLCRVLQSDSTVNRGALENQFVQRKDDVEAMLRSAVGLIRRDQGKISAGLAVKWNQVIGLVIAACVAVMIIFFLLRRIDGLNHGLSLKVKARTAELEEANRRLQEQIRERRHAEEVSRESENKFEMLINTVGEGIIYSDLSNKILFANTRFCEMLGYTEDELIGKNSDTLLLYSDADREFMEVQLSQRLKGLSGSYETRLRRKNGQELVVFLTGVPVKDKHGNVIGSMGTHLDVTELRSMEKKLLDKIRDLDMFFYRSSHDLKGPLASLQGLLRLASLEIKDESSIEYFDKIRQTADKLDQILLGLIEVLSVSRSNIHSEPIALAEFVDSVIATFNHLPKRQGIRIRTDVEQGLTVHCDKAALRSALQNLVHNAINYKRKDRLEPFINVSVKKHNEKTIRIVIADNGVGIAKELQEKIFDVFFRANSDSPGAGLGLYIVKTALEKMSATIRIESEEGQGTSFIIDIPCK